MKQKIYLHRHLLELTLADAEKTAARYRAIQGITAGIRAIAWNGHRRYMVDLWYRLSYLV